MSKDINNKSSYVFKNMLQVLLNNEKSVQQVANCINGFLFYSIPQQGSVEIEFSGETKILRPSNKGSIDDIIELLDRDKSCKITFYLGNNKVIQLQRYRLTRFEIITFDNC